MSKLEATFAYSQTQAKKFIEKTLKNVNNEEEKEALAAKIMSEKENYSCWLIEDERSFISGCCRRMSTYLKAANKIYPMYYKEYIYRRLKINEALEACDDLLEELQFVAESLFSDKNKYSDIVLKIERAQAMIKKLRQSDNRFLKKLIDVKMIDGKLVRA